MMTNGWTVFNTTSGTAATTGNLIFSPGSDYFSVSADVPREAAAKPDDPLDWLHAKVGEVCELGYL